MDCEKFESAMMDELYGELDELTSAAAKRHVAGCARCSALIGGLRATRRVAAVPLVDPPGDLEERILAAAREAQKVVPIRGRIGRTVSMAGSWAMRPQTAMAALFLVMIGTSVLFLRGRSVRSPAPVPAATTTPTATAAAEPAAQAPAAYASRTIETKNAAAAASAAAPPVDLAEEGRLARGYKEPAKEKDDQGLAQMNASMPGGVANNLPQAAPPAAGGGGAAGFGAPAPAAAQAEQQARKTETQSQAPIDAAMQMYRAGRFDDATRAFDALAPSDPNAELWAARSVREGKTCRNALARFDRVAQRAAGTSTGWDALLEGALCYRAIGDFGNARVRLKELTKVDSHRDRAQAELDRLDQLQQQQGNVGSAGVAAKPSPAPRRAAPAATAPPPQSSPAVMDKAF